MHRMHSVLHCMKEHCDKGSQVSVFTGQECSKHNAATWLKTDQSNMSQAELQLCQHMFVQRQDVSTPLQKAAQAMALQSLSCKLWLSERSVPTSLLPIPPQISCLCQYLYSCIKRTLYTCHSPETGQHSSAFVTPSTPALSSQCIPHPSE